MNHINGVLSSNLSDVVVDYIKTKIFTGEYKAGERIIERRIAEDLNISRAPIREGIKGLQAKGLLEFVPRKGNYVTEMTMDDVKEVFDIRLLLENDIIRILIEEDKLKEKDFVNLSKIIEDMLKITKSNMDKNNKTYELNKKDAEFHNYLWERSGSRRRIKILTDLFLQLQLAMIIDTEMTGDLELTAKEHNNIVVALKEKDIGKAQFFLKDHIISYRKGLFKNIQLD